MNMAEKIETFNTINTFVLPFGDAVVRNDAGDPIKTYFQGQIIPRETVFETETSNVQMVLDKGYIEIVKPRASKPAAVKKESADTGD
jgi:hypothetical protein